MMCKFLEANSFKYGTGSGEKPCTCSCYSAKCEQESSVDLNYDYFNLVKDKTRENSLILIAKILDVSYLGELSITFSN